MSYDLLGEEGPDHNKSFEVCSIDRQEQNTESAAAVQRKRQSRMAAYKAILMLREMDKE